MCEWMKKHQNMGNPFADATRIGFNARMNYNSKYTDIMLFK